MYFLGVPIANALQGRREIEELALHKPLPSQLPTHNDQKQMVVSYRDSAGKARIKGGKDLKSSQSYPRWLLAGIITLSFAG